VPTAAPLTRLSFRRDVRIFLTALVGFLAVLNVVLLLVLQQFSHLAQQHVLEHWNAVADIGAERLDEAVDAEDVKERAGFLMTRYGIQRVEVVASPAPVLLGDEHDDGDTQTLTRVSRHGPVRFSFDRAELDSIESRFALTASLCIAAAAAGMFLLFLFIPRITKPIEEMLGDAQQLGTRGAGQDEAAYLVETFRETIGKLQAQEGELRRLHESEKVRADELQLVTATLTRSLTSGFIALDAAGQVLEVNASARETLGIPAETDVRTRIEQLLPGSPLAAVLLPAIAERQTISRVEVEHTAGTSTLAIGLTAVPLIGEGERFLGMLALFTDLTPFKRLESRVRTMQTLAELGEISAGIAHEFRNSLATILGYLRLARRSENMADAQKRLDSADAEAVRLNEAVRGLLTFAKPMTLQIGRVDLNVLAAEVVDHLAVQAPAVTFSVEGDAVVIDGDGALLASALENVVRNAVDAVAEQGDRARVAVRIAADPASITVTDNGIGFDEAAAQRYLLPFVSDKPNGFGLGLSLARKITVLHGGELTLTGHPGAGAEVVMVLGRG
jgi:signal transduction histidine kinase